MVALLGRPLRRLDELLELGQLVRLEIATFHQAHPQAFG
jgi:hypothetical protein